MAMKPGVTGKAHFSADRRCRFWLSRTWEMEKGIALFVGLNPSKAGEDIDDMTVTKGMGFATRWGLGGTRHVNAYPFIATNPADLAQCTPEEIELNDLWVAEMVKKATVVVVAWGAFQKHMLRFRAVSKLLAPFNPVCLGMTGDGFPRHISRIAYATPREPWKQAIPGDEYKCQFCEAESPAADWKDNACPKCGRKYDCILAQEGDD